MLSLTRKFGESIIINGNIKVTVLRARRGFNDQVKLEIEAPREIPVNREEVQKKIDAKSSTRSTLCLKK